MCQSNARKQPVTKNDWPELHPMPKRHAALPLSLAYDETQMAAIQRGFKPTSMDEKWFIYFAGNCLYLHRSWTGILIFRIPFKRDNGVWRAEQAIVNRDPEEYGNTDDAQDRQWIAEAIDTFLLAPDYEYVDGFATALDLASQPNYLGSPLVVRDAITPLFASKVGWWVHLHDKSMPAVTAQEVGEIERQVAGIFAGENSEYAVMPWHSVNQLGQSAIVRFNLNVEYCADESMFFVMFESIAAISLAITSLLKAYQQDKTAQWPEAIRQLHGLQEFVESVMLGTADITHPGKTLRDFHWQTVAISEDEDMEEDGPIDPNTHPCPNDKGQEVHIKHPQTATSEETWNDPDAIATFVPGGDCPNEINGIACKSWDDHPEGEDWAEVDGQMEELDEPPMQLNSGKQPASGVVVEELDGRIWLVSPTNQFGGYKNTFPKGKEEDEMTWQASAIKEAHEEAGLKVRIIGYIGDVERSTTVTRYYRAIRVGGMPVDMGWESQAVHLVPRGRLMQFLNSHYDHQVVDMAFGLKP